MQFIKNVFIYDINILVLDVDNKLWIFGDNSHKKTGFHIKESALYSPIDTGIILNDKEEVKKFYSCKYYIAIYTSLGRLFISKYIYKSKKNVSITNNNVNNQSNPINQINMNDDTNQTDYTDSTNSDNSDTENDEIYNNNDSLSANDSDSDESMEFAENNTLSHSSNSNNLVNSINSNSINSNSINSNLINSNVQSFYYVDSNEIHHYIETNSDVISLGTLVGLSLQDGVNTINHTINNYNTDSESVYNENNSDIFDNSQYFNTIQKYINLPNRNSEGTGMYLFEDGIDDVLFIYDTIFFMKKGELFVSQRNLTPNNMIINKKLGLSSILHKNTNGTIYYKLIFPFDVDKISFGYNFVHLTAGRYHHILTYDEDTKNLIYVYFKTDIKITTNDIYFNLIDTTIYLRDKSTNTIYKYCHMIQDIKEFSDGRFKNIITSPSGDIESILICVKPDGLYLDEGVLQKTIEYHELMDYIIDINTYNDSSLIIVDCDSPVRIVSHNKNLFFNVHDIIYYKIVDTGIIYYDNTNTLYYCTNQILSESDYNTMEVDKISTLYEFYYIYIFKNIPDVITNISFSNHLILIESDSRYYYHTIDTELFRVDKFTEIIIMDDPINEKLVSKHYVIRNEKSYKVTIPLFIGVNSNRLEKLLNITEMLRGNVNFNMNLMDGKKTISYGNGVKREFMDTAICEFAEKYLVKHSICVDYNIEEIKKLTKDQLYCIGTMLHSVICHNLNHLPIRLPLTLICAIAKKEPSIAELEYFIKMQDIDTLRTIQKYKFDSEKLQELGYESYEECLKFICKYYHYGNEINNEIRFINQTIASGFRNYNEVKNLSIMSIPTVDYFLSGDYLLDRDLLLKNLHVHNKTADNTDYYVIISEYLKSLSEENLTNLLKNWTGSSTIKKEKYEIYIEANDDTIKNDIYFGTCNCSIFINERILSNPETRHFVLNLLCVPINTMVDI